MKWLLFFVCTLTFAADIDSRYCTDVPLRDDFGRIARSRAETYKFKRIHPCPATKLNYGACPGWNIDHVIPLAVGGCDLVMNMQWLPVEIKRCSGTLCKDRWELWVYKRQTQGYN